MTPWITRISRTHRKTRISRTHRRTRISRTHRRTKISRTHRRTRITDLRPVASPAKESASNAVELCQIVGAAKLAETPEQPKY